jgi:circadian clock protein KaiC
MSKNIVKKSDADKIYSGKEDFELIKESVEKSISKLKWTPQISVHENKIDEQHKKILAEIKLLEEDFLENNSLLDIRKCIHFLSEYIKEHFTYEEGYMAKIKYPKFEEHKKIHGEFIKIYKDLNNRLSGDLTKATDANTLAKKYLKEIHTFLGNWWLNHIATVDHQYCEFSGKCATGKEPVKSGVGGKSISQIASETKKEIISQQRKPAIKFFGKEKLKEKEKTRGEYVFTGISGLDDLFEQGIPKGSLLLVAGGAGSGKTILCLQTLANKAKEGKKCLYITLEESEEKLMNHMKDFGWDYKKFINEGKLKLWRINPFDLTRNIDALLAKQKGELLIDIDPVILPKDFSNPDFVVIDSLTAIASAFTTKEESYREYIEQLFRFLEKTGATAFLVTETAQVPKIFSPTGVEEFLADGVIVLYSIRHGNIRENAIEVLKLRGGGHQKKIVAMTISSDGIEIYPEQEVFSEV